MVPLVIRYPLDPTGTSPDNFIDGEKHTLPPNRRYRCIATQYGAFFTDSVVVTDLANNKVLEKGKQYYPAELYEMPTDQFGKEICAILVITDPEVSNEVLLDYQCLGGEYGTSATAVIQQIEKLKLDDRPIKWGDIIGKPSEFPPAHHYHDIGDVYGFEYVVHALDRIRQAILMGDSASHDAIYHYIDVLDVTLRNLIAAQGDGFNNHVSDYDNPHRVTATQLGCYIKSEVDVLINALTTKHNTHVHDKTNPHAVTAVQVNCYDKPEVDKIVDNINKNIGENLKAHIADKTNPHAVTAEQLSCYTKSEIDSLLATANGSLGSHVNNRSNPHVVTKEQIGLSNVQNFGMASNQDAISGVSSGLYLSPAAAKAALDVHRHSGDHDERYMRKGEAGVVGSIRVDESLNKAYIWMNGTWKQIFPAQWA